MKSLALSFLLMFSASLSGQGGFRSRQFLPHSLIGVAKCVFEVSSGNYVAGGIVHDTMNGASFNRLAIVGLNSTGQIQWSKKLGGPNFEYLDNLFFSGKSFLKKDNAFYFTFCVKDSNDNYFGVLLKFNFNGDTVWQKIYRDTSDVMIPENLTASVDGGFLITGAYENFSGQGRYCLLIKTDANGNELWRKKISKTGSPNVQSGHAVLQDSASRKIVIVGYQYIGNQLSWTEYDNILILDSVGNTLNQKHFNSGYLLDLIQTKDKKIIAVGVTEDYSSTNNEYYYNSYMVKFDLNNPNLPIWKKPYYDQTARINLFSRIEELPNGEILIGGSIDSLKTTDTLLNTNVRFIKIDPANGNVLWRKDYSYPMNDDSPYTEFGVTSLEATTDGGWVAAIRVNNVYRMPLFYVKYDSTGCDTSAAWCKSVALGISELQLSTGWYFDIYPNPAMALVNISFNDPVNKKMLLEIRDISGKLINDFTINAHDTTLNVSEYKAGVYFVNIISEGRILQTKRLLIEK